MLQQITQLLQLQERDQRLRQLQKDLKDIPLLQQRAKTQLSGDQAAVDAAHQAMREIEVKIKSIELDVQTRENTIKRLQDQQFQTRKNDEFQALGHEIQRYQNEVRSYEDTELEHMEQLDNAKATLKAAQAKLAETQKHIDEELVQLESRKGTLQQRLDEMKAERDALATPVDSEALDLYARLIKNKGDSAVVPLENGICGGCHMKVVLSTIQQVKQEEKIAQCEMCGRVLYLIE